MSIKNIAKRAKKTGEVAGLSVVDVIRILSNDAELNAKLKSVPESQQARVLERELSKKSGTSAADINASLGKKPRTEKKVVAQRKTKTSGQGIINVAARATDSTRARQQGILIAKRAFKAMKKNIPFETYRVMTPEQKVQVLISAIGKDKTVVGDVAEGVIMGIQQRIAKFAEGSAAAGALEKFGTDRGVKGARRAITAGTQASAAGEKIRVAARRRGAGSSIKAEKSTKKVIGQQLSSIQDIVAREAAETSAAKEPKTKSQRIAAEAQAREGKINYLADSERPARAGKPLFQGAPIKFARYEDGVLKEVVDWKDVKNADISLIANNIGRTPSEKGTTIVPIIQNMETKEWSVTSDRKTNKLGRIFERAGKTGKLIQKVGQSGKLETPVPMMGEVKQKVQDKTPVGERKLYDRIRSARGDRLSREYTDQALVEIVKANQEAARKENRVLLDKIDAKLKSLNLSPEQKRAAKKEAMTQFHKDKAAIASPRQIAQDILGVDDPAMVRRVARIMRAERLTQRTPATSPDPTATKPRAMKLKPQNPDEIKASKKRKEERLMALKNDPSPEAPAPKPIAGKRRAIKIGREVLATGSFEGPALRSPRVARRSTPIAPSQEVKPGVLSRESILAMLETPAEKRQMKKVMKLSQDFTAPQMRTLVKRGVVKVSPAVKSAAKNLGMMGFVAGVLSQLGDTQKRRG